MRQLKGPGVVNAGSMASLTRGTLRQTRLTLLVAPETFLPLEVKMSSVKTAVNTNRLHLKRHRIDLTVNSGVIAGRLQRKQRIKRLKLRSYMATRYCGVSERLRRKSLQTPSRCIMK